MVFNFWFVCSSDITVEPPSEEDVANAAQFRLRKLWAQDQWEHVHNEKFFAAKIEN